MNNRSIRNEVCDHAWLRPPMRTACPQPAVTFPQKRIQCSIQCELCAAVFAEIYPLGSALPLGGERGHVQSAVRGATTGPRLKPEEEECRAGAWRSQGARKIHRVWKLSRQRTMSRPAHPRTMKMEMTGKGTCPTTWKLSFRGRSKTSGQTRLAPASLPWVSPGF